MADENVSSEVDPQVSSPEPTFEKPQNQINRSSENPKSPKKGFAKKLIGILLLILIIGGLIIVAKPQYESWQAKRRDITRKADIKSLQNALESFKGKTQDKKYYPSAITEFTMVKTGIIQKLLKDPKNSTPYTYVYSGKPDGCSATCTGYVLFACLENAKDPEGQAPKGACQTKIYEVSK